MADVREQILARILAIGQSAVGTPHNLFVAAYRNRGLVEDKNRPAFVLLDGAERSRLTSVRQGRGGARGIGPQLMTMLPEVYFLAKEKRPTNADADGTNNVGTLLNTMRLAFMQLVEMDATLRTLIGSNGEIEVVGYDTDLKGESTGSGTMRIDFSITYVFDPTRQ